MKTFALLALAVAGVSSAVGCATPAYSPAENQQQIDRAGDYNVKQMTDDFDYVFELRPASRMTIWNVR